jgi:hypothetical protein
MSKAARLPPYFQVAGLLTYDPATGELHWRKPGLAAALTSLLVTGSPMGASGSASTAPAMPPPASPTCS